MRTDGGIVAKTMEGDERIYTDLILHSQNGSDYPYENLLVVELKKEGNNQFVEQNLKRLERMTGAGAKIF